MGSNPTGPTNNKSATSGIIEYLFHLQKEGYKPQTIDSRSIMLRLFAKNCNLSNPEEVKEFIASRKVSTGRKENYVYAYSSFAKFQGIPFSPPRYVREDSLPFIPLESELEGLISASRNLRHATFLRLLKESGIRRGEGAQLRFKDFDFERKTVRIIPEKKGRAREIPLSDKLVAMLKQVFGLYPNNPFPNGRTCQQHLERLRRIVAKAQNNPRFLSIHLHSFRHFRATSLYHQTKDLLYVQRMLGHRSISNTIRYTQLVDWKEDSGFVCKAAKSLEEASSLIENGFDYVTDLDGTKLFRKRK